MQNYWPIPTSTNTFGYGIPTFNPWNNWNTIAQPFNTGCGTGCTPATCLPGCNPATTYGVSAFNPWNIWQNTAPSFPFPGASSFNTWNRPTIGFPFANYPFAQNWQQPVNPWQGLNWTETSQFNPAFWGGNTLNNFWSTPWNWNAGFNTFASPFNYSNTFSPWSQPFPGFQPFNFNPSLLNPAFNGQYPFSAYTGTIPATTYGATPATPGVQPITGTTPMTPTVNGQPAPTPFNAAPINLNFNTPQIPVPHAGYPTLVPFFGGYPIMNYGYPMPTPFGFMGFPTPGYPMNAIPGFAATTIPFSQNTPGQPHLAYQGGSVCREAA